MTTYELYLVLHIGGAIAWMGAGLVMVLLGLRATLARDGVQAVAFARDSEWLGLRLFLPSNLLVLASALLLVHEGDLGFDQLWIRLGIAGFAVSFLTGALFFAPGWGRVRKIAESEGADSPAVQAAMRRLALGARLDLCLLFAVVFVMTVKPTSGEHGALAVAAAILAAFAALSPVLFRVEGAAGPSYSPSASR